MQHAPSRKHAKNLERVAFFCTIIFSVCALLLSSDVEVIGVHRASAETVTTTIAVSICGNAIVDVGEVCDDGLGMNDGTYSTSTLGRKCSPNCRSYGPYCGDTILQAYYLEECDDGNNTNGDRCSLSCEQEEDPISSTTPPVPPSTPSGDGGGSGGNVPIRAQTQIVFEGKAYPNVSVQILKDGQLVGIAQSDSEAKFSYLVSNATPGPTTFGFWAEDAKKIRSITQTTTFQVTQNAVTNVGNVYLPPTIRALVNKVRPGAEIAIDGTTVPSAVVNILLDKSKIPTHMATSSSNGAWDMKIPTTGMTPEIFHTLIPFFEIHPGGSAAKLKSTNGLSLNIFVGNNEVTNRAVRADINNDGKVNMVDFSMLLFHWGSTSTIADLNSDGKVNIADFSVLLFNWTG